MKNTIGQSSLDVFDFGVLLQALAQSGKVGTLRVAIGSREKYIVLNQGRVEAIFTARSRFRVGTILYNMRVVEKEDIRHILEDQKSGKIEGPLGNVLVDKGLVGMDDLEAALRYQMVEELLEVFYWKEVSYEFFSGPPEECIRNQLRNLTRVGGPQDANGILLHVTKVLDDIEQFNRVTPSLRDVYELVRDPEEFIGDQNGDVGLCELINLIDGCRDVGEILNEVRHNSFDAMELFARLRNEGLVRAKNGFELLMLAENRQSEMTPRKRVRLYERVAQLGVDGFDVSLRTAEAYEELEKREKAAEKYLEHARHMSNEGDLPAAETAVAQAIALSPDSSALRRFHVDILKELGREDEAAEELTRLAGIYRGRMELPEAEAAIAEALNLVTGDDGLLRARIEVLRELDRPAAAANAALDLARVREAQDDFDGARKALREAVDALPSSLSFRGRLISFLGRSGDTTEAGREIAAAAWVALKRVREKPERARKVLAHLEHRLVEIDGEGSAAFRDLAEARLSLGDRDGALELLTRSGEMQVAENRHADARDTFTRALEIAPGDLDLGETLALVHARLGSREEAFVRLRRIAGQFWRRGVLDRAEGALREMLRLNRYSPEALLDLARLTTERGRKVEASEMLARVGQLYRAAGNLEDAVTYLDEACRMDPANPTNVRLLADALGDALKTRKSVDAQDEILAMLLSRQDHTGTLDVAFRILDVDADHPAARRAIEDSYEALGKQVSTRLESDVVPDPS